MKNIKNYKKKLIIINEFLRIRDEESLNKAIGFINKIGKKNNFTKKQLEILEKNLLENKDKLKELFKLLKKEAKELFDKTLSEEFVEGDIKTLCLINKEEPLSKEKFKEFVKSFNPVFVMSVFEESWKKNRTKKELFEYIDKNWEEIKNKKLNYKHIIRNKAVSKHTRFFRDVPSLEYYKKSIIPVLKNRKKVKILSFPCSEGREPYSIAMINESENLQSYTIDAFDIFTNMY